MLALLVPASTFDHAATHSAVLGELVEGPPSQRPGSANPRTYLSGDPLDEQLNRHAPSNCLM